MCLDDALLNSYLDGELLEPWKTQVEEHLSYCNGCQMRLEQLRNLDDKMKSATLCEDEIAMRADRVMSFFEKNRFDEPKKQNLFSRKIQLNLVPALITSAAAFVVVFIGSFVLFNSNNQQTSEILPEVMMPLESSQVQQVSNEVSTSLDDYTLPEIIHYLDSQGYIVTLEVKTPQLIDN
jgi:predicted anti-sigma-YlaC factor YlaD